MSAVFSCAQHYGYPISATVALEAVVGDVAGAAIALVTVGPYAIDGLSALACRGSLAVATLLDVTLLIVSLPLLVWQLYARRGEPMARGRP